MHFYVYFQLEKASPLLHAEDFADVAFTAHLFSSTLLEGCLFNTLKRPHKVQCIFYNLSEPWPGLSLLQKSRDVLLLKFAPPSIRQIISVDNFYFYHCIIET